MKPVAPNDTEMAGDMNLAEIKKHSTTGAFRLPILFLVMVVTACNAKTKTDPPKRPQPVKASPTSPNGDVCLALPADMTSGRRVSASSGELETPVRDLGSAGGILELRGRLNVSHDLHCPKGVHLSFARGASIVLAPGVTLTLEGSLFAPLESHIFRLGKGSKVQGFTATCVSPRWWGAIPDDTGNDTLAFYQAGLHIQSQGGGRLRIPRGVYQVGRQHQSTHKNAPAKLEPEHIIFIKGCEKPVVIEGDPTGGTILKAAPGLKYGSFDPITGQRYDPPPKQRVFTAGAFANYPYHAMVRLVANRSVIVRNLELDGNAAAMIRGGKFGDKGIQLPASGVILRRNTVVNVEKLFSHHHPLDGVIIRWNGIKDEDPPWRHRFLQVRSTYNGRQGLTVSGANSLVIKNSQFSQTGMGTFSSAPMAGIDLEPVRSIIRNVTIEDTEFNSNRGAALVADHGHTSDVTVRRSILTGSPLGGYVLWVNKPRFAFSHTTINGRVLIRWGGTQARFSYCQIKDYLLSNHPKPWKILLIEAQPEDIHVFHSNFFVDYWKVGGFRGGTLMDTNFTIAATGYVHKDWVLIVSRTNYTRGVITYQPRDMKYLGKSFYFILQKIKGRGSYKDIILKAPKDSPLRLNNPVSGRRSGKLF